MFVNLRRGAPEVKRKRKRVVTHFGYVEAGFSPASAALKGAATSKCVTTCKR